MSAGASASNSFVSVADSADASGHAVSGMRDGWMGLGNSGWSVNFGGSGMNLQGGASALPNLPWLWIAAGAALWWLWKKG